MHLTLSRLYYFLLSYTWNSEKDLCLRSTAIPSSPLWEGLYARYTLFYRSDFHPFHECLLHRARILAARVVGENMSGVFYAHLTCALPECWQRQLDCRIINITCYKNVISMKRSARRQKMYVLNATLYHRYCRYCTVPYRTISMAVCMLF